MRDFEPYTGYSTTDPRGRPQHGYGPWSSRLLLAFSEVELD